MTDDEIELELLDIRLTLEAMRSGRAARQRYERGDSAAIREVRAAFQMLRPERPV